jgi:hypothetical protein
VINGLDSLTRELEADPSLAELNSFRERIEALDRLDAYALDRQFSTLDCESVDAGLYRRASALYAKLEATNLKVYETIRGEIQRGAGPNALLQWTLKSGAVGNAISLATGEGYDYLDELVSGVLRFVKPDAGIAQLPTEMVSYQPTPARHIFDLIARTQLAEKDVLIDLGSGLGHVPLLALYLRKYTRHRDRGAGSLCELRPAKCLRAKPKQRNLHPARRARREFVRGYGVLSVHPVPWHHSAHRDGLAPAGSGRPPDSSLHVWPLHAKR